MNIPKVISQITFGSGYPLGPGGHWRVLQGAPGPRYNQNVDVFCYPGYPGMIPEPETRNPFGGILNHPHKLNYLA